VVVAPVTEEAVVAGAEQAATTVAKAANPNQPAERPLNLVIIMIHASQSHGY
jgi:hypothetical protein